MVMHCMIAVCRRLSLEVRTNLRTYANSVSNRKIRVISPYTNRSMSYFNQNRQNQGEAHRHLKTGASFVFVAASLFVFQRYYEEIVQYFRSKMFVIAAKKKKEVAPAKIPTLTSRELRFLNFASVEFEGQIFMTPRDFLDSVTQVQPRTRQTRRLLSDDDVKNALKKTPPFDKGSKNLFRQLSDNGLISYTEYLFLLCILTKPTTGFRIAFNMFDTDGNQRVDKKEFLVIQALTLMLRAGGKIVDFDPYLDSVPQELLKLTSGTSLQLRKDCKEQLKTGAPRNRALLENVFASSRRHKAELQLRHYKDAADAETGADVDRRHATGPQEKTDEATQPPEDSAWKKTEQIMETMRVQDTTLLMHFFGSKGDQTLVYDDFYKFMENLQTEVLEVEFTEFSRGKPTITEADFATILLRYTMTRPDDYKSYMDRVREKFPDFKGISFDQFRQFCKFLTHLDDFSIAVKLYTFTALPVSQNEFARAVKISTGFALDPHVIETVFQIFDVDNDGRLSYSEFIAVMRERLHRGFKTHVVEKHGWDAYKQCIRAEMKRY